MHIPISFTRNLGLYDSATTKFALRYDFVFAFSFGYLMGVIASVKMNVCILVIWGSARNENINTNIALLEKKNNKLTL